MSVSAGVDDVVVVVVVVVAGNRWACRSRPADLACYETCSLVFAKTEFSIYAVVVVVVVVAGHLVRRFLETGREKRKEEKKR